MNRKAAILIFILIITVFGIRPASAAEIIFIGNPSIVPTSLTRKEIKDIFLGKQRRWSDNKEIELALLKDPNAYPAFVKKYTNRSTSQYRNWWREKLFSGQGRMPQSFDSEIQMMAFIAETEGAIGFVTGKIPAQSNLKRIQVTD